MSARRLLFLLFTAGFAGAFGIRVWLGNGRTGAAAVVPPVQPGLPMGATTDPLPPKEMKVTGPGGKPAIPLPPESVETVLAAGGFEFSERLGRFLPQATAADLERLFEGLKRRKIDGSDDLRLAVFLRWMELDPAGGLKYAGKQRDTSTAWTAWRAWGQVDADAAMSAALASESPSPGRSVLEGIADVDPAKARGLIEAHPEFAGDEAYVNSAASLMRTDPAAGATIRVAFGDVETSEEIRAWVRRAPEEALAWARSLPDQHVRTDAMKHVLSRWAQADPRQAGEAILALPEGRLKRGLFADHAGLLAAAGDLVAARDWLERAPSPTLRSQSLIEMAAAQAQTDPAGAIDTLRGVDWSLTGADRRSHPILGQNGVDSELWSYRGAAISAIASKIPAETMAYVAELPESAPVDALSREVFYQWLKVNSLAASEWLAGQPDGPIKVDSTAQLVGHLIEEQWDIESAVHWAMTLPAVADGTPAIEWALRAWLKRGNLDAAAASARAAIDSLPVSAEERQRLINLLPAQP
ncbi:MAG: hypothetical protein ACKV19_00245 [Verrucomicrobiales bacterium]